LLFNAPEIAPIAYYLAIVCYSDIEIFDSLLDEEDTDDYLSEEEEAELLSFTQKNRTLIQDFTSLDGFCLHNMALYLLCQFEIPEYILHQAEFELRKPFQCVVILNGIASRCRCSISSG